MALLDDIQPMPSRAERGVAVLEHTHAIRVGLPDIGDLVEGCPRCAALANQECCPICGSPASEPVHDEECFK